MSALLKRQIEFTRLVPRLIDMAFELGFSVTLGDAYRDPRVHGDVGVKKGYGHSRSNHKNRLAIDLNLFKDGLYLTNKKDHEPLGKWWESHGGSWGGRFEDGDANHYSFEFDGMR